MHAFEQSDTDFWLKSDPEGWLEFQVREVAREQYGCLDAQILTAGRRYRELLNQRIQAQRLAGQTK